MATSTRGQLRNKIRDAIFELQGEKTTTHVVVDLIIAQNPKLIEQEKQRLIRASLSHIVRQVMHTPNSEHQLLLPLGGLIPNLPPRIPVRTGAKNGPATWVELGGLTLKQLTKRIEELSAPRPPGAEIVALIDFRTQIEPYMQGKSEAALLGPAIKKMLKGDAAS